MALHFICFSTYPHAPTSPKSTPERDIHTSHLSPVQRWCKRYSCDQMRLGLIGWAQHFSSCPNPAFSLILAAIILRVFPFCRNITLLCTMVVKLFDMRIITRVRRRTFFSPPCRIWYLSLITWRTIPKLCLGLCALLQPPKMDTSPQHHIKPTLRNPTTPPTQHWETPALPRTGNPLPRTQQLLWLLSPEPVFESIMSPRWTHEVYSRVLHSCWILVHKELQYNPHLWCVSYRRDWYNIGWYIYEDRIVWFIDR